MDPVNKSSESLIRSNDVAGFADYSRAEHIVIADWKKKVAATYDLYGFMRFEGRKIEKASSLTKKGEGGIQHEIWGIGAYREGESIKNSEELCLPFDHTVPLAIWVAGNQGMLYPLKRQAVDYSWRVETPQAGRFRAFIQADVDIVDRNLTVTAESECISAILAALNNIGINDFTMYLNHIAVAKGLISILGLSADDAEAALRIVDKLDKITPDGVTAELLKLSGEEKKETINALVEIFSFKGSVAKFKEQFVDNKFITEDIQKHINDVYLLVNLLDGQGIDPSIPCFSPGMVRGLDYYTGIVFETFLNKAPHRGSIASGGRFDNLVDCISETKQKESEKIRGFGGSIGLTRLFDVCLREQIVKPVSQTAAKVLICCRKSNKSEEAFDFQISASNLAGRIRKLGINADLYTNPETKMKDQLAYANSLGFSNVIIIVEKSRFVIKDMVNAIQHEVDGIEPTIEIFQQNLAIQIANENLLKFPLGRKDMNAPEKKSTARK